MLASWDVRHTIDPAAYLHAAVIAADRGEVLLPWHFPGAAAAAQ